MNIFGYSYAKMIDHGLCTIDQIPDEHREATLKYVNNDVEAPSEVADEIPEVADTNLIHGALTIPKIDDVEIDTSVMDQGESVTVDFRTDDIFTTDVLAGNPNPHDIYYRIGRVENVYGKLDGLTLSIAESTESFSIIMSGTPKNITSDCTILRVDLIITSSNYEDMRLTIYFNAK